MTFPDEVLRINQRYLDEIVEDDALLERAVVARRGRERTDVVRLDDLHHVTEVEAQDLGDESGLLHCGSAYSGCP